MEIVCKYFLYFIIYSFLGWFMEVCVSLWNKHKFINRGFLIGPYCPIYGWGCLAIILVVGKDTSDILGVFLKAILICSLLEYFTSYFMEKIFNVRWWDYSNERFNLEGRICLRNAVAFGILGMSFIYVINPIFLSIVNKIPHFVLIIISIILFISFLIDNILTFTIMNSLKSKLANVRQDSTSDIDKQVREILSKHTFYINKLFKSFPKVKFSFPFGEQLMNSIMETLDNMNTKKKERKKRIKELKHELKKESKK